MRDSEQMSAFKLNALAEAIKLTKEAYLKTKDRRIAAAALILTELALEEADEMNQCRRSVDDE